MSKTFTSLVVTCLTLTAACLDERALPMPAVVYQNDIASLLATHCVRCHGPDQAEANFRVDSYTNVLGCVQSDAAQRAIDTTEQGRPLLAVLDRPDHAGLLAADQRARLGNWLEHGAPLRQSAVHAAHLLNPRSAEWHGKLAAQDRFGPLLRADHPAACGRCHAGAPVTPRGIRYSAPDATACTTCHTSAGGVLACATCHGDGAERADPPRQACSFGVTQPDAHHAHLDSTRLSTQRLQCSTCHPAADSTLRDHHADGVIDVVFDPAVAGERAEYRSDTGQCTVACHDQQGARARPSFHELGPMGCGDCHGAPPQNHYSGECTRCHSESNADGSALRSQRLHMNGTIDVGDGSGRCSVCHGQGDDPMPPTASHQLHRNTQLTLAIDCADCHSVPQSVTSPGHLDQGETTPADVVFGPRATAGGQHPTYVAGRCSQVACHGAGLPEDRQREFVWDAPASAACSGCHGLPPAKDHPADSGCATLICHGREVSVGDARSITEAGRALHINGMVDVAGK